MAEFPGFTLWTDAYLGDTGHLSTLEHGAYLLLLITMWRAGGSLPNDDKKLARYARLNLQQWSRIKATIMDFMTVNGEWITQGRLTDELAFVKQKRQTQSDNARSKSRKNKQLGSAVAEPKANSAEPNASQTSAPTPTPTLTKDTSLRSVAPSAPKPKPARLSSTWVLPEEFRKWALEKGLPAERVEIEANKMRDWSINSKNGAKTDWFAAWRNWVQKALDDLPKSRGSPNGPRGLEWFDAAIGYLDEQQRTEAGTGIDPVDVGGSPQLTIEHRPGDGEGLFGRRK